MSAEATVTRSPVAPLWGELRCGGELARLRADGELSRSDGIVDWRACLDPHAQPVEIDSSHIGMAVHPRVYRVLERALDASG